MQIDPSTLCLLSSLLLYQSTASANAPEPPSGEVSPAVNYARGGTTLLGSATFSAGFFGGGPSGTGFDGWLLSGGVALRVVTRLGLTVEPRIGIDAFAANSPSGLYAAFAARTGLGVGWAVALGPSVAITPMLSYEVADVGGGVANDLGGVVHIVTGEVPLAVFFGRRAFLEVFMRGGVLADGPQIAPVFAAGYRLGVVISP